MLCMAVVASAAAAPRGSTPPSSGPPLAPRTHGFMLYFSQPLGGGGGLLRPKLGFRIEQVRLTGNSGAPDAGDPMQHHALVGWQLDGLRNLHASDMKLELGSRMSYDITHAAFKPLVGKSTLAALAQPAALNHANTASGPRPFAPHELETRGPVRATARVMPENVPRREPLNLSR
jgi:hypothetical protein